jgi:glycine betaine/proline transport system substrate-binding protein
MIGKKLKLVLASAALSLAASAAQADCGEVSITDMDWASGAISAAVTKFILEQGYGCEVTAVPSSTVPAVASVAETGKPDILVEIWVNSVPQYKELVDQGKIKTVSNVLSDGGEEGWWIPKYLADAHPELTKIDAILAHPELVGGLFNNCPEGWGCRVKNDHLKVAYDFAGHGMKVFDHGSGETLATSLAAAYADKQPWFGYYWAPTSVLGRYPMVMVDIGPYVKEAHECISQPECASPQKTAFPKAEVVNGVTADFAQREPEVYEFLTKISFTNAQMGEVLAWQEDNNASTEEAAVYFLTHYKDVWSAWLNDAARDKLAAVLK